MICIVLYRYYDQHQRTVLRIIVYFTYSTLANASIFVWGFLLFASKYSMWYYKRHNSPPPHLDRVDWKREYPSPLSPLSPLFFGYFSVFSFSFLYPTFLPYLPTVPS